MELWSGLQLDAFWATRLPASRKGTAWLAVLRTLVAYRLIAPGSEWRLHRQWYANTAMADLLRSNLADESPAKLWQFYIQLTEVEQAFKALKSDLSIRPIWHQKDEHIEAHIFVAFLAYCLQVSLKARLKTHAPGLTLLAALHELASMQMVDMLLPTTNARRLILSRTSEADADQRLLLAQLELQLPKQLSPRIAATAPLPLPVQAALPCGPWRAEPQ